MSKQRFYPMVLRRNPSYHASRSSYQNCLLGRDFDHRSSASRDGGRGLLAAECCLMRRRMNAGGIEGRRKGAAGHGAGVRVGLLMKKA